MTNTNSILYTELIKKIQIKETVLMLAASTAIPFFIHLIPSFNNVPIGAILLPMFYAPFIAIVFFRLHVALLTGILGPTLNFLLTGSPKQEMLGLFSLELVIFVIATFFMLKQKRIRMITAPVAFIFTKLLSPIIVLTFPFIGTFSMGTFVNSFVNALPGIFVLLVLNITILSLKDKD